MHPQQLVHAQNRLMQNLPQRPRPKRFMIRNDHSRIWILAPQNHMATALPLENKNHLVPTPAATHARKEKPAASSANAGRQLDILNGILFGNRISCQTAILEIELHRLTNIRQRLISGVPLRNTTRKDGYRHHVPTIGFSLQNNRILHRLDSLAVGNRKSTHRIAQSAIPSGDETINRQRSARQTPPGDIAGSPSGPVQTASPAKSPHPAQLTEE